MTSSDGTASAGWYPDPHEPGQLRYYDGREWTDNYHREGELSDFGAWIRNTFGVLRDHWVAAFGLSIILSTIGTVVLVIGFRFGLGDLAIVDEELVNVSGTRLVVGGVILVVAALWQAIGYLALNRYMQRAHQQTNPTIAEAFVRGLRRLPKLIGWYIALVAALVVVVVVVSILFVVHPILGLLGVVGLIVLAVYALVKLAFFFAALAAVPDGVGPVTASAEVSVGRFWPILGRVLFVAVVAGVGGAILNAMFGGAASPVDQGAVDAMFFTVGNETFIRDTRFADLVPSGGGLIAYVVISSITSAITAVLSTSAIMRLYLDAGGPSEA